jgi:hypothetical protein
VPDPRGQVRSDRVPGVHDPQRRDHQCPSHVVAERRLVLLGGQPVMLQMGVGEVTGTAPRRSDTPHPRR